MRLSRCRIRSAIAWSTQFIILDRKRGKRSRILKAFDCAERVKKKFNVNHNHALHILAESRIKFITVPDGHWAETDGEYIWLNVCKCFSEHLLRMTLLHEALHGIVIYENGDCASEFSEHRMMYNLIPELI